MHPCRLIMQHHICSGANTLDTEILDDEDHETLFFTSMRRNSCGEVETKTLASLDI